MKWDSNGFWVENEYKLQLHYKVALHISLPNVISFSFFELRLKNIRSGEIGTD